MYELVYGAHDYAEDVKLLMATVNGKLCSDQGFPLVLVQADSLILSLSIIVTYPKYLVVDVQPLVSSPVFVYKPHPSPL